MKALAPAIPELLSRIDRLRLSNFLKRGEVHKSELGQFFTPLQIANLMASMFECPFDNVRLLDAGAGIGGLFAAATAALVERERPPREIEVTAYETDKSLEEHLHKSATICAEICRSKKIKFRATICIGDFIKHAVDALNSSLFDKTMSFNCAILNPPYRKINCDSEVRSLLRRIGIETSNLYTGFLATAINLLEQRGELVAISPRSFCNGPYFLPFRRQLLAHTAVRRIHIFDSRKEAFKDDAVLQETVIFHIVKGGSPSKVLVTSCARRMEPATFASREMEYNRVVTPGDPNFFIHIPSDRNADNAALKINKLRLHLEDLELFVSTGRVVDFRARRYLRANPEVDTVPLIYPAHLCKGIVTWPKQSKKPNAIVACAETADLLIPNSNYVLVKRFSSKEERKRIVAVVYSKDCISCDLVGFENHMNYYHRNGKGLPLILTKGLSVFLNSTPVDVYFRQFNGHTQVNATDLRSFKYPTLKQLESLGKKIGNSLTDQTAIDALVDIEVFKCQQD